MKKKINSRNKGKNFELWICKKFRHIFPDIKRKLEFQEGFGYDTDNTGNLLIQAKCYAKYPPLNKIEEVPRIEGKIPVLVAKGNQKEPVAVLYLDDFIKILEDIGIVFDD